MEKKPILLISFYNGKALGVRYLEKALQNSDIPSNIIFFKNFNSIKPKFATEEELSLLCELIENLNPLLIGLSVMSSMYLDTVYAVNDTIRKNFKDIPIVWGGVYPSLFAEKCLEFSDFVIKGEGEQSLVELYNSLFYNHPYENIKNLAYKKNNTIIINELYPLCNELDKYGHPNIDGRNKYCINDNKVSNHDPLVKAINYELISSRGCPFACSYCSCVNLKRLYKNSGNFVRFREVDFVIEELKEAKKKIKGLKMIHFWDEIFSDDPKWIDDFITKYKKEIGLPFQIWGHPLKTDEAQIKKLVSAGLFKVVMGIQSGSKRIRKDIFHRIESQEDIINASKIFNKCKVPHIVYDFILKHPFETEEDIKETYKLCNQLEPPFELQLHGLNFLPGTDIVEKAIKMNIMTKEELDSIMYSSIQDQYKIYWNYHNDNILLNFWYNLTFISQFPTGRYISSYLSRHSSSIPHIYLTSMLHRLYQPLVKVRGYYKKAKLILTSFLTL